VEGRHIDTNQEDPRGTVSGKRGRDTITGREKRAVFVVDRGKRRNRDLWRVQEDKKRPRQKGGLRSQKIGDVHNNDAKTPGN